MSRGSLLKQGMNKRKNLFAQQQQPPAHFAQQQQPPAHFAQQQQPPAHFAQQQQPPAHFARLLAQRRQEDLRSQTLA